MICDVLIIDSYAYPINDELYMFASPRLDPSQY